MDVSDELKLEGIIAKRAHSIYQPGKYDNHADVVVIGWREGKGSRANTFGSLLLATENSDGDLTYAVRVGIRFSEADLTKPSCVASWTRSPARPPGR